MEMGDENFMISLWIMENQCIKSKDWMLKLVLVIDPNRFWAFPVTEGVGFGESICQAMNAEYKL